jgi:hypothetical protein
MTTDNEKKPQGEGKPNATAITIIIVGVFVVIGYFITAIANIKDIIEWPIPIKILALAVPGILWLCRGSFGWGLNDT